MTRRTTTTGRELRAMHIFRTRPSGSSSSHSLAGRNQSIVETFAELDSRSRRIVVVSFQSHNAFFLDIPSVSDPSRKLSGPGVSLHRTRSCCSFPQRSVPLSPLRLRQSQRTNVDADTERERCSVTFPLPTASFRRFRQAVHQVIVDATPYSLRTFEPEWLPQRLRPERRYYPAIRCAIRYDAGSRHLISESSPQTRISHGCCSNCFNYECSGTMFSWGETSSAFFHEHGTCYSPRTKCSVCA